MVHETTTPVNSLVSLFQFNIHIYWQYRLLKYLCIIIIKIIVTFDFLKNRAIKFCEKDTQVKQATL